MMPSASPPPPTGARLRALWQRVRRGFRERPETPDAPATAQVSQAALEELVQLPVRTLAYYEQALTHRSQLRNQPGSHLFSNERLEFLGDALLGFVVAAYLYEHFPDKNEGFLTRLRAKLVRGKALAQFGRSIGLGDHILMSDNMAQAGGRDSETILADAFEALIGALYLDLGLDAARLFIHRVVLGPADLDQLAERRDNHKSQLLEYAQAHGWPQPRYEVVEEEGPSHDKTFTVDVILQDAPQGRGRAGSKKKAEQLAAREALDRLQEAAEGTASAGRLDEIDRPSA